MHELVERVGTGDATSRAKYIQVRQVGRIAAHEAVPAKQEGFDMS